MSEVEIICLFLSLVIIFFLDFLSSAFNIQITGIIVIISFFIMIVVILSGNWGLKKYREMDIKVLLDCKKYIEQNKIKIGLFSRNYLNKTNVIIANKYCCVKFELIKGQKKFCVIDKISGKESIFCLKRIKYLNTQKKSLNFCYEIFTKICSSFDYEIKADKVLKIISLAMNTMNNLFYKVDNIQNKTHHKLFLDINQASEAELTAIPGVTIAKAKHAIKVRNQQKLFLTMNQFYEAIDLGAEFIEQIQTSGNKIILNELPEYKKLQLRRGE